MSETTSRHTWRFFRAGGFDQVRLDRGEDLAHIDQLDQTLWVALACPTRGVEFDYATLDVIDTDKDGRIRAPEIIAATKWAVSMLKSADELVVPDSSLALAAINDASAEGKQVLASAKQILTNLGKGDALSISVDDVADTAKIFAQTKFNGDGIIPADSAEGEDAEKIKAVITDIMACLGEEKDRSGKPGVSQPKVDLFFKDAQTFADWWAKGESDAAILPLGSATAAGAAALKAVRVKVDDYFARCRLAAFDARAINALNREEKEYLALAAKDLTITSGEIAALPLAKIEAGKPLPLGAALNPAWAGAIGALHGTAIKPLLGDRNELSEAEWSSLVAKFAAFDAWSAGKPATCVEKLGLPRVKDILAANAKPAIDALLARDKALEPEATAIAAVDKLVRFKRDLWKLLNNFINFRDFYARKDKAIFQVGRLYLDQRACDLCVRVDDAARHGLMAHLSQSYLAYCDVIRKSTGEKMSIAAAFTAGDSDNLMVGRNGVFYDRKGNDYDATITKVVDNPISIRQAFWSPYKRLVRWIGDQIAKRAAAADAASTTRLTGAASAAEEAARSGKEPPQKPKIDIGVVAAIGVAVGGLTAALGVLLQAFFGLGWLMPLGVLALVLLISGPSMIIAWLKLRQRNLGPILDANGWAVNARAKINIPFGRSLTKTRVLPPGSQRDLFDPYAEKHTGRTITIIVVILLVLAYFLWFFGAIEKVAPGLVPWKSSWVQAREKEAADEAARRAAAATQAAAKEAAATATAPTTKP